MEFKLLIAVALVVSTQAGPIDTIRDSCSQTCPSTNKFGYRPGKSYEFDYNVKTSTSVKGASEGLSEMELTAKVHVEAVSKCDFILRIADVRLHETDPTNYESKILSAGSEELRSVLERHDLRFSFQDGIVEELCPSSDEVTWALNIKRGILSVFQNSMDDLRRDQKTTESDVNGNCEVEYATDNSQNGYVVRKTKNLLGCTERNDYSTSVQGIPYRVPSENQAIPVINSQHQCQQEISSEGLLKSASCIESHTFRPFSREGSGAVTESKQTLNFVQESVPASTPGAIRDRRGMTFEHAYAADKSIRSQGKLEGKLMEVCENTRQDVRPDTPQLFSGLVYLMKTVDAQSLRRVYQKLRTGSLCANNIKRVRKFFLDAIPMAGTSDSLSMLAELINDEEITGIEADMWLTTLSFIQHPTKDMIREVLPLLSKNNGKAMLAVASLVHNFCRKRSCDDDMDVSNIISTIEGKIEYGCNVDGDKLQKTIMSLRALGNAGHAIRAVSTINSCLTRRENPAEVRLAAIEAFRRMSCDADRSEVQTVFTNREEDSEIRIAAYLALMQCPNVQTIELVKQQLETEEVNQVGSFIWSHLSNLKETSNIHKQNIRTILQNEELRTSFDLDDRKFSHNYEKSIFLEKLNAGASVESNLIWSSSSFLPRSVMANLTVDLFGHSVNLFEVGGRVEGLEYFLESYFGPNGYFGDNEAADVNEQTVKGISSRKMRNIGNQFETAMDDMKATLYTRVFGNELGYVRLDGTQSLFNEDFNILEMLISMSQNHDYTMTQNFMFMDSSMIIPTCSGFPLNLTVNGTATVDMKASGKMDLRKVATSPRSLSISGAIQPSAALEVSSMMSVDAFVSKSGMKMVSTLHTSTAIQGKVELADGRILEMELDVPREKIEIVNFKTSFFTVHKDLHREQEMIMENRQSHKVCTGEAVIKVTGLQLCGEVQFPNASLKADAPYFPLTGPVKMAVDLTKKDTLTSYKFETKFVKTRRSVEAKIAFNTPGSTVDRNMGLEFLLNNVDKSVTMDLVSPWKKASVSGSLTNERTLKQFQGRLTIDTTQEYSMNAEVRQSRKGSLYVYTPTVEVTMTGKDNINLGGSVEYLPSKSIEGDLTLAGITVQPVKGRFSFQNKKTIRSLLVGVSFTKGKEYSVETRVQTTGTAKAIKYRPHLSVRTPEKEVVAFGGTAEYRRGKSVSVDLTVSKIVSKDIKLNIKIRNMGKRYQSKVDIITPYLSTKVQSSVVIKGGKAFVTRTTIDYVIPKVIRDKITVNGKANIAMTKALKMLKGNLNVALKRRPQYNIDSSFETSHTRKTTGLVFDLVYGANKKDQNKRVTLSTTVKHQRVTWPESTLSADFDMKHLGMGVDLGFQGRHTHETNQLETSVTIQPGRENEMSTSLRLKNKSKGTKNLSGTLTFSYGGENIEVGNDLNEATDGEFTNTLTAQWAESKRDTIVTTFRLPSSRELIGSVDVNLADMRRVRVAGQYFFARRNMSAFTEVRVARDKYALSTSYQITDGKASFTSDVEYPSRHITFEADVKRRSPLYTVRTDLLWDADRDVTKRFQLDGQATVEDINTVDVSVNNKSPLGVFAVNLKHRGGNKYISHADVEWGRSKRITMDTTFSNKRNNNFAGTLRITTPFRGYRSVALEASHVSDSAQYSTTLDVDWKPIKKISTTVTIQKPISLTHFEGEVVVKSPVKGFQRTAFGINHSLTDRLSSIVKFTWNKNLVQLNVDGANKGTSSTRDVTGRVSLKTTLPRIGSMYISGGHTDDGRKFANNFSMTKDGKGITYEGEMTHEGTGWQVQNSGRFSVTALSHSIQSTWNHENTPSTITTILNGNYGGKNIEFDLTANQALTVERGTGSLSVQLTGNVLPTMGISATHEHDNGLINNGLTIQQNAETLVSIKNKYGRENDRASSVHTMEVMDKVYTARLDCQYNDYPYSGTVQLDWAPSKTITFSTALDHVNGLFSGSISLQSTVMKNVVVSFNQNKEATELISTGAVQYGSTQVVSLENRLRINNNKRIFLLITSELEDIRRLETNMEFTGDMNAFQTAAYFELQPLMSRISASSQWNMEGDIIGNIRIDTPFATFPYIQITATSKLQENERTSVLNIEYLPSRVMKLESSYKNQPGDLLGSVALTTPFNQIPRVAATAKFTGSLTRFRSSIALEDIHGQKYEAKTRFGYGRRVTGEVSLKAPHINDIVAMINHEGNSRQFTNRGQLTWLNGNRYQTVAEFTREGKLEGKIILKSPHFEDITVTAHHTGNVQRFQSNAGLRYGDEISEVEIVFVNDANVEGSAILRSPFTGDMSALFQHNGNMNNFQSHAEVQYQAQKQFEADAALSNSDNTEGSLKLKSPMFNTITVLFNKNGQWNNFQGHGEVQYQTSNKIEIDGNFNNINRIEGSFRLQNPYTEDISAAVHHTGNLQHFQCHAELIYHPTKKIEGDLSFANADRIEGALALKTPFCEDLSAAIQYEKQSESFSSHGDVQYGTEKIQCDVSLGWGMRKLGSFALKTPFTDDMHAAFQHSGNWKQCSSHAELSLSPRDKNYEVDFTFANARKVKASASVKSKHFQDFNFAIINKGRFAKFNNKMSAQYGEDKLETDLTFNLIPSISAVLVINTPFKGYRKLQASVKHDGSWNDFNSKATAAIGKSKIVSSARFTLSPLSADVNVQTPFSGYKQLSASISHAGTYSRFQSRAEVTYGKQKSIVGDLQFNYQPLTGLLTVTTPFTGFERFKAKLSHERQNQVFHSIIDIDFPRKQKLLATANIDLTSAISADITVVTPFKGYQKMTAALSHTGSLSNFACHAEAGVGPRRIVGDARFSMLDMVSGEATLTTPFRGFKKTQVAFSVDGTIQDFRSHAEASIMKAKHEVDLTFAAIDNIVGNLVIQSPYMKSITAVISHSGNNRGLTSEGKLVYGDTEVVSGQMNFNSVPYITGTATIKSVWTAPATVTFSHSGDLLNFNSQADAAYADSHIIVEASLDTRRDITGSVNFRSPFSPLENLRGSIAHSGSILNGRSHIGGSYKGEEVEVVLIVDSEAKKEVSIDITTPYNDYRHMKALISHTYTQDMLTGNIEMKLNEDKIEGQATINMMNGLISRMIVKSPWYNDVIGEFSYAGPQSAFVTHSELTYSGMKQFQLDITFENDPRTTLTLAINTPFSQFRNIQGTLTHSGTMQQFTCHADFQYGPSKKLSGDITFSSINAYEGSVSIKTPFVGYETITAAFRHDCSTENLSSHLEISYQPNKKLELDVSGTLGNSSNGHVTIKTPFAGYEETTGAFTQNLRPNSYEAHLEAVYSQGQRLEVETAISSTEGHFALRTPFSGFEEITAAFNNVMTSESISGHAEAAYQGQKIEVAIVLSYYNSGRFTIKTPFVGYEELTAAFTQQLTNKRFTGKVELSPKIAEKFEISVDLSKTSGQLTVKTPMEGYEMMSAAFTNRFTTDRFTHQSELTYLPGRKLELDITVSSGDGRVVVRTPFNGYEEMSAAFTNQMTEQNIATTVILTYLQGEKIEAAVSISQENGQITLKTPFIGFEEMSASYTNQMNGQSIINHMEIHFQPGKQIEIDLSLSLREGSIVLRTPFTGFEVLSTAYQQEITETSISGSFEVSHKRGEKIEINISFSAMAGHLTVQTPFEGYRLMSTAFSTEVSIDSASTKFELSYNPGEKFEADVSLSLREGHLIVKTPITGYETFSAAYSVNVRRTNFAFHAEATAPSSDKMEVDVNVSFGNRWKSSIDASFVLKTPFSGFEMTSATLQHVSSVENEQIHAQVIYGNQKKIQADMTLQTGNALVGSISLNTPFTGFESSTASFDINMSDSGLVSNVAAALGERSIRNTLNFAMTDNSITGSINLQTPFEQFENVGLNVNAEVSWAESQIDMSIVYDQTKPVELLLKHTISADRYDASLLFRTLYTPEVTASVTHNGNWRSFSNNLQITAGTDNNLQQVTICRFDEDLVDMSLTLTGRLDGRGHLVKSTFKHQGQINNFRTNLMNNFNGRKSTMTVSFRNAASIDGSFAMKTPFKLFKNIAATLQHSGDLDQFSTRVNFQFTPTKQISGNVDFFNHHLRRLNANIELTTPFEGLELTKLTYRHTVTSNDIKCFSDVTFGTDKVSGSFKASKTPLAFDVALQTPFTNFEAIGVKAKYARQGLSHNINVNVKYRTGKEIVFKSSVDLTANPIMLSADVTTPFAGYELTELRYTYSGRFPDFRCTADFAASYASPINGELAVRFGSIDDMQALVTFTSPFFENAETLRFILRNQKDTHEYQSHSEVAWTQTDVIVVDGSFANSETWNGNTGNVGLTVATPFSFLRSGAIAVHHDLVSSKYTETVNAEWNGEKMLDMDVVFGKDTSYVAALTMRAPRQVSFSSNGELTDSAIRGDLDINWNTESQDSNVRMAAAVNDKSDSFTERKDVSVTVTLPRKTVVVTGSLTRSSIALSSSGNLIVDGVTKYGIDYETSDRNRRSNMEQSKSLAIRLPSRTLKTTSLFSDSYGIRTTEGAIFWDAGRDETQKIGVRGSLIPQGRSTKADFSVSFPSLGKNVKLDSEVTMNSGNIIFDGKTEFSYSGDVNKNLVIHSRVEDLSSGFRKNYSFVVGVTHPATTIDVQLTSNLGHADNKYSADMGFQYLTANRNRKNFALMGEIDNMRNQMKFEMVSPIKSIKVSGQVSTSVPYRLSIHNLYDERPVDAELIIDPSKLSMGFHMNYDLDNQGKVLHAEAKYVNNSAIRAEIYREENTQRITDSLFAMRLNTSRMLHTRLHWRPTLVQDLKTYGLRRMVRNSRDFVELYNEISSGINEEVNSKYNSIRSTVLEELAPYFQLAANNIIGMQREVTSLRGTVDCDMLNSRICIDELSDYITTVVVEFQNLASWMETAASSRVSYPMKDSVDEYIVGGSELLQAIGQESRRNFATMMNSLDVKLGELSTTALLTFKTYHDHMTNAIAQPLNTDTLRLAKAKYNAYVSKVTNQLPSINDLAQRYTSTLYNGREQINSALYGLLDRPEVDFIQSKAAAAYKFWEVEENTKAALASVYDHVMEIIEDEIEALKTVITDLEKTKITVFDPVNGEVQTDTYLVVPMKSLKALPGIDVIQHYNNIRSYVPDISELRSIYDYIPSSDFSTWMPPFDAFGTVEGNTFTTFDGKTYQFNGRCSYVLAGDYMDGNFSIVLDYMGKQKRRVIITTTKHAVQLLPKNKLRVDGVIVEMPYHAKDLSVVNEGDDVTVSGHGFTVRHNVPSDVYEIGLSGWYYGKTGGLLGTYDNERHNDMMMPSRQLANDVTSFADTWEVNDRCR